MKVLGEEKRRLEDQVQRLMGRGKAVDEVEAREDLELWRENKIRELESVLAEKEDQIRNMEEQSLKNEERVLDLRFQKETFDL